MGSTENEEKHKQTAILSRFYKEDRELWQKLGGKARSVSVLVLACFTINTIIAHLVYYAV